MTHQQIIATVQSGNNVATEENIFVPMTQEQRVARSASFVQGLKMNMFKMKNVARFKGN